MSYENGKLSSSDVVIKDEGPKGSTGLKGDPGPKGDPGLK